MLITITKENYESVVSACEKTVILDFGAAWCQPCKKLVPVLEELSREREDLLIAAVDVESEKELAVQLGVLSVPTLLILRGGMVQKRLVGFRTKKEILKQLDK